MTKPRRQLINYSDSLYYSITSRCVRRTFLCGEDPLTQKSYEHRRKWIEDRIRILSSLFSLEILSYAVMSNHIHVVLKAFPGEAIAWSDREVIRRWLSIYRGPLIARRYLEGVELSQAEWETLLELVKVWRQRLDSISWFMKCLNEPIARQANKEDGCTGHFWEARFHSRGLYSEEAILTAMAYVDLNPVRASMAPTPEDSSYTSIKERITETFDLASAVKSYCEQGGFSHQLVHKSDPIPVRPLAKFVGGETHENQCLGIHCNFSDYLALLDYTGRAIVEGKSGHIDNQLPDILFRLSIKPKTWFENVQNFDGLYYKRFAQQFLLTG